MFIEELTNVAGGLVQVDNVSTKPNKEEETDAQDNPFLHYGGGAMSAYRGYSRAPLGTLETYRWMDVHPTLSLAKGVVTTPAIGAPYSVEADENVPKEWKACIEKAFLPDMPILARDAFDALSLRWQPFEVFWQERDSYILPNFKPLLQEMTSVLVERDTNRIVGLKNSNVELTGPNWYSFAEHPKNGRLWGLGRHECCRESAWWPWMEADRFGGKLDKKSTGIVFMVWGPQGGSYADVNGKALSGQQASLNLANTLQQGISAYCPNTLLSIRELKRHTDLKDVAAFRVEHFDLGDTAKANDAIVNKQRYRDSLMFRGWKRPERSATEGQRGTLAEAEVHGDIGTDDSDLLRVLFAISLNRGPVDDTLEQNFGRQARGKVYLKPSPIVPARFQVLKMMMEKIASVPALLSAAAQETDMDAFYDVLGVPKKNDRVNIKWPNLETTNAPSSQPASSGKAPGQNGNGNVDRVPARNSD